MRHGVKKAKLQRNASHRKALLANQACSLISHGRITTTLAKAKALMDQVTRVQHENGQIPTHWMNTEDAEKNFWFNCMFYSCYTLEMMAEYQDVEP